MAVVGKKKKKFHDFLSLSMKICEVFEIENFIKLSYGDVKIKIKIKFYQDFLKINSFFIFIKIRLLDFCKNCQINGFTLGNWLHYENANK